MLEENFERRVKETMEEFTIPPSAAVWQKVEREIRQRKERRRLVLWILPLLLAGGVWLFIDGRKDSKEEMASTVESVGTKSPPVEDPIKKDAGNDNASSTVTNDLSETSRDVVTNTGPVIPTESNTTIHAARKKPWVAQRRSESPKAINPVKDQKTTNAGTTNTPSAAGNGKPLTATNDETKKDPEENSDKAIPVDTKQADVKEMNSIAADTAANTSPASPEAPSPRPRKWKVALQATGGYAQTMEKFFPIITPAEADVVPTALGYSPRPKRIEPVPGKSLSLGVMFTSTMSTTVKFTTGVQYSYASTRQSYGDKIFAPANAVPATADSSERYIYTSGNQYQYVNRYHLLEIPAGIDVHLFSTLPVELHTGVAISGLFASNALHYLDSSAGYYRNKRELQRAGLHLYTGFSYSLLKNRLRLGPHLQYSITALHKDPNDKRHLLSAGVRARLSIN